MGCVTGANAGPGYGLLEIEVGKLALAAKITHVPSMYLSELPGRHQAPRRTARTTSPGSNARAEQATIAGPGGHSYVKET